MLDVEEQGLAVRRHGDAGDFAVLRSDQEAAHRICGGIRAFDGSGAASRRRRAAVAHLAWHGGQHHAVGHVRVGAVVGLNPQQAARVEIQAVRAGEIVDGGQARQVHVGGGIGLGCKQVNVPGKAGGRDAATRLAPADDVAVRVALLRGRSLHVLVVARIGGIGLELAAGGRCGGGHAVAVVGEGHVRLAIERVDAAPFRTVHLGGTADVGGNAGVRHHVGLVGKGEGRVAGVQAVLAEAQFQPLTRAVGIELCDIQRAFVEVLGPGGHAAIDVLGIPHRLGDELVDVLITGIVTHVHHDRLADHSGRWPGTFVVHPAERRSFGRRGGGVERVDLDHPAERIGDIAVVVGGRGTGDRGRPAGKQVRAARSVPEVGALAVLREAVAVQTRDFLGGAQCVVARRTGHNVEPVFFTGEIGAPRGVAVGAVVVGAAGLQPIGGEPGPDQRAALGRAGEHHLGGGGDTAVEARAAHHAHVAAGPALDFHHAHAVRIDFLFYFAGDPRGTSRDAGRVQAVGLHDVFVVDGEQAAVGAGGVVLAVFGQAEEVHAVMAIAHAAVVGLGTFAAVVLPRLVAVVQRITQGMQDADLVALGNGHQVIQVLGHGVEAQ